VSESQNIKSKLTRKNVLESISSLLGQLKNITVIPENGLVMFSGAIPQNNTPGTEKNEMYIVHPPEKVLTENGLVMFSGAIPQNNTPGTEKNEMYIVHPPEKVLTFRYHCASEFLLWPLEDMLETKETYGLLSIGRKESAVGYLRGSW